MMNLEIARLQYESFQTDRTMSNVQKNAQSEKLRKACEDFEAIFIKQMLSSMKKTVNRSGLMGGGFAEEIYEDMLYDEYAKKMTKTAGFGIAKTLYNQLSGSLYL